jgi:hypothetical protein
VADPVERYLELALRLGRHAEDLVDSYYGPGELASRVEAEELREPATLAVEAKELELELELEDDPWLAAQVRALGANARKLAGEQLGYAEEVRLVYGIEPSWKGEEAFGRAATLLDEALPGSGDLRPRYARWFEQTAIPAELLEQALLDVAEELRHLTRSTVGLPEGEEFELELVSGKRWTGYAGYLGGLRTRISINTDLPLPAGILVHLTSHEIYGGHHTRVWQEAELVRKQGQLERTLDVLWSPEAVISEGVAQVGPKIVVGEEADSLAADVLGRLGFEYDAEVGAGVGEAQELLTGVSSNVAMLLHDRGSSADEAREYAATWSHQPDDRLDKMVSSQLDRNSPGYQHLYWQGRDLVDAHVGRDVGRFRDLLVDRVLPSSLAS